ncbi:MAG: YafY family transcriptional regulator [Chloroflexales bacterium]|nr:YafY family transcriptional regulator [Chloroflexales bacterium]
MYHPTTRVLTVLELLQARPGLSGAAIAAQLEVDRRTVRRYITMLQDLGIPIETTRGPHGGYRLRPGFKLPPLMLADDEALAITLSLIATERQGLSIDPLATTGARAKIERVLPESLRERLQAVREVVAFHAAPPVSRPDGATLMRLSLAAQRGERVLLRYRSGEEETERCVDPYGLVFHSERWYLAAWCHVREGVRVFRLDRVQAAEQMAERFTRPAGFDSLTFVLERLALTPWGWDVEVLLEATLEDVQRWIPPGSVILEEVPEGVLLRGQYDQLERLATQLLLLECPLVVRQPPELRAALRAVAERALAISER